VTRERGICYYNIVNDILGPLRAVVGTDWSDDPAVLAPMLIDWRGRIHGSAAMVVWPRKTAQVAAIVAAATAAQVPLLPQ